MGNNVFNNFWETGNIEDYLMMKNAAYEDFYDREDKNARFNAGDGDGDSDIPNRRIRQKNHDFDEGMR